ncbi:MAG: hypothetical protein OZSIB_1462 [Candidatus Ozemobacter sibiricus]|uniref:Spermidine synthase n=1 Tax=Candidatus Ozemobacter sibiricus TaxID=2268124 RepID=A0A367ZJZ7_9BACT|nr:MAG: hypothetical protein OZSIB_1462 [Candidatus Ozemobacter sibiricus]
MNADHPRPDASAMAVAGWLVRGTAFLGSFLLFVVQPLAGKELLPRAGGSFMVWAVALAFFQVALLGAYLLVHLAFGRAVTGGRVAAFLAWAMAARTAWMPADQLTAPETSFTLWEWRALTGLVGLPFLALGTGQLALQRWWQAAGGADPAFIFAASNAGSLAGLLAFPLVIEPRWTAPTIWAGWHLGTLAWALAMGACALLLRRGRPGGVTPDPAHGGVTGTAGGQAFPDQIATAPAAPPPRPSEILSPSGENPDAETPERPSDLPPGFAELAGLISRADSPAPDPFDRQDQPPAWTFFDQALPALAGSALLAATTNLLTMDVAAFPLLWAVPLALYLLTWIQAFAARPPDLTGWEDRFPDLLTAGFSLYLITQLGFTLEATVKGAGFLVILYFMALICHTVARHRQPAEPAGLTRFYLALAAGGALGSLFVGLGAPLVFSGLGEYPFALFLGAWAVWRTPPPAGTAPLAGSKLGARLPWPDLTLDPFLPIRIGGLLLIVGILPAAFNRGMPETGPFLVTAAVGAMVYLGHALRDAARRGQHRAFVVLAAALCLVGLDAWGTSGTLREAIRNFYGLYKVYDSGDTRFLQMGSTLHGHESLTPAERGKPLYYYHPATPIGAFLSRRPSTWERLGVVGLGAGVLAAFGEPGQTIAFFELDPDGLGLARRWFSYLERSPASVTVAIGDGRLALRAAATSSFDLLILDAFSSDAIPVHLLTLEAIADYRRVLRDDGVLLFHVSNRHFDLRRLLVGAAWRLGLEVRLAENPDPEDPLVYPTRWVAMGSPAGLARHFAGLPDWTPPASGTVPLEPWTDQHSSLWSILGSLQEFRLPDRRGPHAP